MVWTRLEPHPTACVSDALVMCYNYQGRIINTTAIRMESSTRII